MDRSGRLHYERRLPWACMTMTELDQLVFQLSDIIILGKKKKNEQESHLLFPNCLSYKHCWLQFITRAMANTQAGITKNWNAKELKFLHVIHSVQMVFRKKSRALVWKWNQILELPKSIFHTQKKVSLGLVTGFPNFLSKQPNECSVTSRLDHPAFIRLIVTF